ncbi:AbrB/MazE/SpoVT family DNA-binding domain-containing protein [Lentzea sp. NBC_00516]|uniref:AbrB/MazE/SpoVT family DNA-binding domain-containing protein n=1 Tax=Lentzea sp. NBC_00516 TaxID=2903582 RepID=UPI002E801E86|nr:AbrB/MazE/SpoVT family DNA-binding domain-containing protein [Lentzea sp. NBC_00516]WUD26475.1 AbrB/MazE/SpoVT family DNA-binding domain-containing protein [Lentzea sp. NBC_00516]
MTISYIRPIVPDTAPGNARAASGRIVGQPLPLIAVPATPPQRLSNVLYSVATVDDRGRVADRQMAAALNWTAATRLSIREHDGLLAVAADPHGVFKLTKQGHVRLPADARRAGHLSSGDRVLLRVR